MNSIIWKGVSSTTINGLLISELPPITVPAMRVKEIIVDGRDGSILEDLGYSSYDKNIVIGLHGNFDINKVIKYFTGEGEVVFSNEPDKVYTAKIIGQIDYNRLLRYRQATIPFRVQPFKHKLNEAYKPAPTAVASGISITINDGADANLKALSIYGKTTQNGTPTPEAPVDLVSVGDGGFIVVYAMDGIPENNQGVIVQTPNGLPGIPVSSGGNYTDENGQQWICDEIDLIRGVYVQRTKKVDMGTLSWWYDTDNKRFLSNSVNNDVKRGTRVTRLLTSGGYSCKYNAEAFANWDNAIYPVSDSRRNNRCPYAYIRLGVCADQG